MIVVSDTSPLNYLILIEAAHVLPALFQQVYLPGEVATELQHSDTPIIVKTWIANPPPWLLIRIPKNAIPLVGLDPGETQAINLAQELHADHLLIDEWAGRAVAKTQGLHVIGTLGVLLQAAEQNLIDLKTAFDKLTQTTFRADPNLLNQLLASQSNQKS